MLKTGAHPCKENLEPSPEPSLEQTAGNPEKFELILKLQMNLKKHVAVKVSIGYFRFLPFP